MTGEVTFYEYIKLIIMKGLLLKMGSANLIKIHRVGQKD